jgi:hypothetical protein
LSDISSNSDGLQQFWLQVQLNKCKSLVLCVVYRPPLPNSPPSLLVDFLMPSVTLALSKCKDLIILGDLNCDMLQQSRPESRALLELCSSLYLYQIITTPTHVTENTHTLIEMHDYYFNS